MNRLYICVLLLSIGGGGQMQAQTFEDSASRPLEKWIYRAPIDGRQGVISLALHERLWAAYDTQSCEVFQTWQGGIRRPHPDSAYEHMGYQYYQNQLTPAWKVTQKGKELAVRPQFDSMELILDHPIMHYRLLLPDSQSIVIKEYLSFHGNEKNVNRNGLTQTFWVESIPAGVEVHLAMSQDGLFLKRDLRSSYKFADLDVVKRMYRWGPVFDIAAEAILHPEKPTALTMVYTIDMELEASRRGK